LQLLDLEVDCLSVQWVVFAAFPRVLFRRLFVFLQYIYLYNSHHKDDPKLIVVFEGLIADLPTDWKTLIDEKNELYYFNLETQQST
jgi:hypothetical protein